MKITQIQINAGRTFNHPYEQYSNLRSDVHLSAELAEGDDPTACAKLLQGQAEQLAEDHKQSLLKSIHALAKLRREEAELRGLQKELTQTQSRLDAIRQANPALKELSELAPESAPDGFNTIFDPRPHENGD